METYLNKEQNKINKIIEIQRNNLLKLEKDEKENREKGEQLYSNYQLISEVLLQIRKALEKYSFDEIKEKLKGHKLIKNLNSKDKTITIEL